jgi:hypothetical protein
MDFMSKLMWSCYIMLIVKSLRKPFCATQCDVHNKIDFMINIQCNID